MLPDTTARVILLPVHVHVLQHANICTAHCPVCGGIVSYQPQQKMVITRAPYTCSVYDIPLISLYVLSSYVHVHVCTCPNTCGPADHSYRYCTWQAGRTRQWLWLTVPGTPASNCTLWLYPEWSPQFPHFLETTRKSWPLSDNTQKQYLHLHVVLVSPWQHWWQHSARHHSNTSINHYSCSICVQSHTLYSTCICTCRNSVDRLCSFLNLCSLGSGTSNNLTDHQATWGRVQFLETTPTNGILLVHV